MQIGASSPSGIMATALGGLQRNADAAQQAANDIARSGAPALGLAADAPPPAAAGASLLQAQDGGGDPVNALVSMSTASFGFKANLKVVQAQDEMQQQVLKLLG